MQQVTDWLERLGLGQYAQRFAENDISFAILPDLTDQDLKELGIASLGHRRQLLGAIAKLGTMGPAIAPASPVSSPNIAERRQVTVMFSDLIGSTALAAQMDPEDLSEVLSAYRKCVAETVSRFRGFVAKYMGDGVLIYFGYPDAHEDDVERSVRAGLELVAAVAALKVRAPLQTRVGIATGLVVIGDLIGSGEAQERGIVGETPNLAARLQNIAEPNTVVIAESTRKLLGNLFELQDLGAKDLKGIPWPVRAWKALRGSSVGSRFEALHPTDLTALIGRDEELELLLRRWSRATTGEGQAVLLCGEAGIGKSRITTALLESLAGKPHKHLRYFCSPQHTDSALHPIIGQMERSAGLVHNDTPQAKLDKLAVLLAQTGTAEKDAALIAEMLSLPNDGRYPELKLGPQQRRQRTLEVLIAQLQALARQSPVLMIFEDAHWTDPTSLEALGRVVDAIRTLRVLLIVTFRPEFEAPWIGRAHVTALTMNRLAERDVGAMVDRIIGKNLLPANIRQDIIERTDGIPLFIEEMTKAVLEAENEDDARRAASTIPSQAFAVPASLHASLMARLDRLGPAKEVAQIGAAIGREFPHALLAAVTRKPQAELDSALDRLIAAGLLFRQGLPPHATYLFKHALVQDAAYGTLLREPRRTLHVSIVETIESQFPEIGENQPELLARHCAAADLPESAVEYWFKAGKRAENRSANIEVVNALSQGIELVQSLPPTPERSRRELDFYLALAPAVAATRGYSAPETQSVFLHARDLLADGGTLAEQMAVLWGAYNTHNARGETIAARQVAQQILTLASQHEHVGMSALGHRFMGFTLSRLGAFVDARFHYQRVLDLCVTNQETITAFRRFGVDDHAVSLSGFSITLWILGYAKQAATAGEQALARARKLELPFTTALVLQYEAFLGALSANRESALAHVTELIGYSKKNGYLEYEQRAHVIEGILLTQCGDAQHGIEVLRNAIAALDKISSRVHRTAYLGFLASAYASIGQPQVGLSSLDDAIQESGKNDERFFEAELNRLRGELLLLLGKKQEAEAELQHALKIARQQQARAWELRAAMSLARLWRDEGIRQQAYDLLASIYGWFTEGFDTRDLKDAKALLEDLVPSAR
jgi:class 3 adenylate cyclase/tetratricopeptide (TPR) repeat protein